jgi:hypothetical protein
MLGLPTRLAAALLALLLAPAAALALPTVELGARVGYAAAFGYAAEDVQMKEFTIASQIPIQLDAAVKLREELSVGLYGAYGPGKVDSAALFGACDVAGTSCSGHAWRIGVQGRWTFTSLRWALLPWVGAGLGWEWATLDAKDPTGSSTIGVNGGELSLQGGGDWRVAPSFAVGPYLQLGIGRYQRGEVKVDGADVGSGAISRKAFHGWFGAGVAGRFEL